MLWELMEGIGILNGHFDQSAIYPSRRCAGNLPTPMLAIKVGLGATGPLGSFAMVQDQPGIPFVAVGWETGRWGSVGSRNGTRITSGCRLSGRIRRGVRVPEVARDWASPNG